MKRHPGGKDAVARGIRTRDSAGREGPVMDGLPNELPNELPGARVN
ncbi:hypothetical protein [Novacetimonas pomaceti]|nr:hypothetical protein [Novacetimonas pomaceti]MBV1834516.1 hypothetical protein [Novacetimonas pomaceti]